MYICSEDQKPYLAPVCPDLNWPANELAGTTSRVGTKMDNFDKQTMRQFVEYAKLFILREWPDGVDPGSVPGFEKWINELTNYQGGRKRGLFHLRMSLETTNVSGRDNVVACKGFIKRENYPSYKAPRLINSPSDISKVLIGDLCHAIDKKTFSSKFFVKGSNPRTWPEKLESLFGGAAVCATDFTACESHHRGPISEVIKFWMMHMVRRIPHYKVAKDLIHYLVDCRNICVFPNSKVGIDQRLMSGAMWTSSANGMFNLLINSFLAAKAAKPTGDLPELVHWARHSMLAVFEGDDGLVRDYGQSEDLMKTLGLKLKLERFSDYGQAGFCGIVCQRGDKDVAKDPYEVLKSFFFLPPKYGALSEKKRLGLLRAKAMSYKYTFGGCPIIGAMCDWVLYETRSFSSNYDAVSDGWKRSLTHQEERECRVEVEPSLASRDTCEKKFSISLHVQRVLEDLFKGSRGQRVVMLTSDVMRRSFDAEHVSRYCSLEEPKVVSTIAAQAQYRLLMGKIPSGRGSLRLVRKREALKRETVVY